MPDGRESARRSVELNPFASRDDKVVAASLRFAYNTANISELQLYNIFSFTSKNGIRIGSFKLPTLSGSMRTKDDN